MTSDAVEASDAPVSDAASRIRRLLIDRLGSQWQIGMRLPPVKELARELRIGQSNTHKAIQDLVREGYLASRQRMGTYVTRVPASAMAGASREPRHAGRRVGLVGWWRNADPFVLPMRDTCERSLQAQGPVCTRVHAETVTQTDGAVLETFDALVIFHCNWHTLCKTPAKVPTVVVAPSVPDIRTGPGHQPGVAPSHWDIVTVDQQAGGALAGRALRDAGCDQAVFLGHGFGGKLPYDATSADRLSGFEQGWGGRVEPSGLMVTYGYSIASGAKAFRQCLRRRCRYDAVFAASDELAIGFVAAAISHGMNPGRDFKIVGFDGQDRVQMVSDAMLGSIRIPTESMGERAAKLLLERLDAPTKPSDRVFLGCDFQAFSKPHPHAVHV